jgi:hypothetical protein
MGSRDEPGMMALLFGLAATLYAATWLIAGPPGFRAVAASVPIPAIEVTPSAQQLGPDLLAGLH